MSKFAPAATYICMGCPLGCRLEVEQDPVDHRVEVRGFSCKRGKEYAVQEHTAPQRMVTTTVAVAGALWPRLPVKSSRPVPKQLVAAVCAALRYVQVTAPGAAGQVILPNALGCGADIIAARDMAPVEAGAPTPM